MTEGLNIRARKLHELVIKERKLHKWGEPQSRPPGALETCTVCGATRICAIPGYQKSAIFLNGERQRYCPGSGKKLTRRI